MHDPSEDFGKVYFALCKSVDTAYSLGMWLRWKNRDWISATAPNPLAYDNAHDFGRDYLIYSWPSKAKVNLESVDLKQKALESFAADEMFNKETAARLRRGMYEGFNPRVENILVDVRRKIRFVLGEFNLREIVDSCRWGNGASATLSRRRARPDQKITTLPLSVSPRALGLAKALIESDYHWMRALVPDLAGPASLIKSCFEIIDFNEFDTVPKSLKTDRTIAKEPTLNGFLQQGVHLVLRKRLKRVGVDLSDQGINQTLASLAQTLGLATLDLKSASNSVTAMLMELLLPPDWFEFLNQIRSHRTRMPDDSIHKNYMFSSMGNAFTFELESLVFWAIAASCSKASKLVSVYGDDMIVPQVYADDVIYGLEAFGFRINTDKSFTSGRFFESCGKHYFDGTDVTPAFQKANPLESTIESIRAHNRLIRWAYRSGAGVVLDTTARPACEFLARLVPQKFHGPIGPEGDEYLQVPVGSFRIHHGNAVVYTLTKTKIERRTRQAGSYAYWLRLRSGPSANKPTERDSLLSSNKGSRIDSHRREALKYLRSDGSDPWLELSSFTMESAVYEDANRKSRIPIHRIQVGLIWA